MTARDVIDRFGGIRPMAGKLKHPSHTTVQGWWDRNMIPAQRQREVLNAARINEIELDPEDLIPFANDGCVEAGLRHVGTDTTAEAAAS